MKVEVKPIVTKDWTGARLEKFDVKRPVTIEAFVNIDKGVYETGLLEEDQIKYGQMIGVDLTNKLKYDKGNIAEHPFYHSKVGRIKLENHTMIFETNNPIDYVKVALLKVCPFVANSLGDIDSTPEATHYIHSEEEEVQVKANKIALRDTCILEKAKLTPAEKASIVAILGENTIKNRSNEFIDVEIEKIIESKPEQFLKTIKIDKKELNARANILDALYRNVLTKEGLSICYMGEVIAEDYEAAVQYFLDPQNQKIKVAILEKLK